MAKYRKKAITVTAECVRYTQYITTLEGVSVANVGDYVVTGVDNEQWVVKPEWFHDSYTHIKGDLYRRKPQILDAVQIHEPEVVSAPTGPIKGDPGDYKMTGTKGEHWYVKPDIFDKTYEALTNTAYKGMDIMRIDNPYTDFYALSKSTKNEIQKSIDQIGLESVSRYLPRGMKFNNCDMHGMYISHYTAKDTACPLCTQTGTGNGTTATQVEHYIDIRDGINPLRDHDGF